MVSQSLGQRRKIEGEVLRVDTVTCCQGEAAPGGKWREEFPDCRHSNVTASRSYTLPSGCVFAAELPGHAEHDSELAGNRKPHTHVTQPYKKLKKDGKRERKHRLKMINVCCLYLLPGGGGKTPHTHTHTTTKV